MKNCILLKLFTLLLMCSGTAFSQYTITNSDVTVENGVITSCSHSFPDKEIVIPAKLDGQPIKGIGVAAFMKRKITGVVLPESLKTIADSAFIENSITNLKIPEGVSRIGAYAFMDNKTSKVVIPNSVTLIGEGVFLYSKVDTLIIGEGIDSIPRRAFSSNRIKHLVIGENATYIGYEAFAYNRELENINIPKNVKYIGVEAFSACGLKTVTIPDNVEYIEKKAFSDNYLESFQLSAKIDTIKFGVFRRNQIKKVTIPNTVVYIDEHAFTVNKINQVDLGKNVTHIGRLAFYQNQLDTVSIPEKVGFIGKEAFGYNPMDEFFLPIPEKAGCEFIRWKNIWGNKVEGNRMITDFETDYIAEFSIIIPTLHVVTFIDWDGTQLDQQSIESGGSATAPVNPARNGYVFIGWDTEFNIVTKNLTVKALYEATASIGQYGAESIEIYPNPVRDFLNVEVANGSFQVIEVVNMIGGLVSRIETPEATRIDLSGISPGVYYLKAHDSITGFWLTRKFIKY